MGMIKDHEAKIDKLLKSLEKKPDEPSGMISIFEHEREICRLEEFNRRLIWLAISGWSLSIIYILIDQIIFK